MSQAATTPGTPGTPGKLGQPAKSALGDGAPPSAPAASGNAEAPASLFDRVHQVINRIRPTVQSDGGDLELVEVTKDGVVRVRLHGACVGCPSSSMTLRMGIERNVRDKVPEVTAVEQVH